MIVKQLSIFVENAPGRLGAVTNILAENGVNIRALSLADTTDFGVLRVIVDKPTIAITHLLKHHFTVKLVDVIAVEMDDTPGGLDRILNIIKSEDINIEYMYAFIGSIPTKALVIFRVDKVELAAKALLLNKIKLISSAEIENV